jgi:CO/xanthine dehydrogenase Mo-binding subunit
VARIDGHARVTGQATYTSDVRIPGMLHARVLRSPHAHARVNAVASASAEAMSGVRVLWHCQQPLPVTEFRGRPPLREEVVYEGEEVALIVAADRETAAQATAAIEVTVDLVRGVMAEALRRIS